MALRILIAEDNPSVADAVGSLLQRQGWATEHATDGVAALARIAKSPPDVLLLDLKLPGLHGIELLRKLRQAPATRQLPVVIMTGIYRGDRYRAGAARLGVDHYLEKPFKASALVEALRSAARPPAPAPAAPPSAATVPPAQPPGESPMRPLHQHLLEAYRSRFSGNLHLAYADGERILTFLGGSPVALHPGLTARDFGDHLRQLGRISAEEYAFYASGGERRHDALVQLGCLDYPTLLEEKITFLARQLLAGCGRPPVAARRDPLPIAEGPQAITVNIPRLIHQAFRNASNARDFAGPLASFAEAYVATGGDFYRFINFLRLDDHERRFLGRLDGSAPLRDLLAGDAAPLPLLLALQALGMLRFGDQPLAAEGPGPLPLRTLFNASEEEPADLEEETLESFSDMVEPEEDAEPLETPPPQAATPGGEDGGGADLGARVRQRAAELADKNYYQIFDLTPAKFSFDKLKERYFAITREFGPDVLMRLVGEEAELVQELLATVANAYNTLSDVVKKERYDELLGSDRIGLGQKGDDRFQAEVQAQSGKVFIEMEEWGNAEQALQDACNGDPDNGDYLAHLAWSIYRNPRNSSSRAMQDKARQLVNRSLTLERTAAGFAFKGWMLLEAGQDALAETEFTKALKLDARHGLARRGLRTLQEKREQEKKGLFRRMFS